MKILSKRSVFVGVVVLMILVTLGISLWPDSTAPADSELKVVRDDRALRVAVIFVHGIFGSADTFETERAAWPTMLSKDPAFSDANVYLFAYRSEYFRKGLAVHDIAADMDLRLSDARIIDNHSQLVFLCHSMGGLVTRSFLIRQAERVRNKIRLLYFFATPSAGAEIAEVARRFLPNANLVEMSPTTGDQFLRQLQVDWLTAGYGRSLPSYCAFESSDLGGVVPVVHWASALGLCNESAIAIDADHLGIVKPETIESKVHVTVRTAYRNTAAVASGEPRLIQGYLLGIRGQRRGREIVFTMSAAVQSAGAGSEVVTELYGRLEGTAGLPPVSLSSSDISCTRQRTAIDLPFTMTGELRCELVVPVGSLTQQTLETPGAKRLTVTLETTERKGHTAQYCFNLSEGVSADLFKTTEQLWLMNTSCQASD